MTTLRTQQVLKTLGLSIIFAANIFLFIPFTLYIGNPDEFVTPLWSILILYSMPALIVIGLLIVTGAMMSEAAYRCYTVIITVVGLLLWLQGFVMVWEYGLLDGQNINWAKGNWRGWIDLGIWISVSLFTMVFYRVIEKPVINLAVTIFSLQIIILVITGIQNTGNLLDKMQSPASPHALQETYRFSSKHNVLHIILDGFQADVFKDIISNGTEGAHFQSALEGFIFFEENMGVFPSTYLSLPAILSGEIYHNHMPKGDFMKQVFRGKTILNTAFEAGYEVDLASPPPMINLLTNGHYTNSFLLPKNFHVTDKVNTLIEAAELLDLTLFRLAPHFLKKYIYNNQNWTIRNFFIDAKYLGFFYFSHNAFLKNLTQKMTADRTTPVYKFFHLMNTHAPMVVNMDCTYAGGSLPRNRLTITTQSRCSLYYVIALLNRMKELGIYDDSLIIIMADHGAHLLPYRFKPQKPIDGNINSEVDLFIAAMITPLMMVKAPKSSGILQISTAQASILDTAATINSILKLDVDFAGKSVLELSPSGQRERRHYYYEWRSDDNVTDYTGPIQEFIVNGSIYDRETWRLGREFLSPLDKK